MRAVLLILALVCLTACYDITVVQEIDRDGRSVTTTTIVMQPCQGDSCNQTQNPCELAPSEVQCVFDEASNTATYVSYDMLPSEEFSIHRTLLTREYRLTQLSTSQEVLALSEQEEGDSLELFESLGASATHIVIMPAPIISSSVGVISGNQVTIDLLTTPTDIEIIASEEDRGVLWAMAVFLVVFFAGVASLITISVVKKRRKNAVPDHTPAEIKQGHVEQVSRTEKKYRDYILQQQQQFSRKDIKSALMAAGISDQLANKYLDKYYRK